MTRSATRARNRSARAQVALSALLCVTAGAASCRRDFDGLKPDEGPQILPRPPAVAPPTRPPAGTPAPIGGSGGSTEGGSAGGGGTGGGSGATDGGPGDGLGPGLPPASLDAGGTDVAAADATAPAPDAFPPEPVYGDTGRPEVASPGGGVVMYLPLDEGTGAGVAEDASGNLAIGTLAGLDVRRAWVGGKFGSALRFPRGGSASIRVSPVPSLNTVEMTWSLSVWVRLTGDMNGDGFIVSRRAQSSGGFIYAFGVTGGVARLRINSGNGYNLDMSAGSPIPRNDWVHLGVTFDKRIARIYMNGAPVAAQMYELGIPQEETPVYVGAGQLSAAGMLGERYAGDIDEIVMYNRVLPASEMAGLARGARPVFP
jgi:hypothetical protein